MIVDYKFKQGYYLKDSFENTLNESYKKFIPTKGISCPFNLFYSVILTIVSLLILFLTTDSRTQAVKPYLREKKEMCLNIGHSNSKRGKSKKNIHLVKT